jgi:hypothetical protein
MRTYQYRTDFLYASHDLRVGNENFKKFSITPFFVYDFSSRKNKVKKGRNDDISFLGEILVKLKKFIHP